MLSHFALMQGVIPVTPSLMYSRVLDDSDFEQWTAGRFGALNLLSRCDEVWAFHTASGITPGMKTEISRARQLGIPIRHFLGQTREVKE